MTGLNWFRWLAALLAAAGVQAADIRVAVFDFTTIDIQGQKFYEFRDRGLDEKKPDSLSDADRAVIDDRMLGMVKMIDADVAAYKIVHDINRNDQENDRDRARRDELADRILRTQQRSVVIGAEYMIAALNQSPVLKVIDRGSLDRGLRAIETGRPGVEWEKAVSEFGRVSGATHILYGTVADFQTRSNRFSGYGVLTEQVVYSLDLVVKLVDTSNGEVIFSGVFTGRDRDLKTQFAQRIDSGRFERMMKSAVSQAAEAINQQLAVLAAGEKQP